MSRMLVSYDDQDKRLHAIDPQNATGIAIPTARILPSLPAAGSTRGELVFARNNNVAYLWEGTAWRPIISDFLHAYDDDNAVMAATVPEGHIAISKDTGNFFIMTDTGFRQWGIREYTTRANLMADTPPDGSLAVSMDDHTFWMRTAGNWLPISTVSFADPAEVLAWAAPDGANAIEQTYGTSYFRAYGLWYPRGVWPAGTEATLLANNDLMDGQIAFAADTGRIWVRANGTWEGSPIRNFADETALMAATPHDGVLAWAEDTGLAYMRSGGNWIRVNSPSITVAATEPTTPAAGDLFYNDTAKTTQVYDGSDWQDVGAGNPVGTIIMHVSVSPPAGYLLCDGSPIPADTKYDALRNLVGSNTPDLSGQFIRGTSVQNNVLTQHQDTTRRPRTAFTGTAASAGAHQHGLVIGSRQNTSYVSAEQAVGLWHANSMWVDGSDLSLKKFIGEEGAHSHNVTINGGGDAETAPAHVYLAYHIKY